MEGNLKVVTVSSISLWWMHGNHLVSYSLEAVLPIKGSIMHDIVINYRNIEWNLHFGDNSGNTWLIKSRFQKYIAQSFEKKGLIQT